MLKTKNSKMFTYYAEDIFSAAIRKVITTIDLVDIIFNTQRSILNAAKQNKWKQGK